MARYAAALALFDEVEALAGLEAMQAWFQDVWRVDTTLDTETLHVLLRNRTGADISAWFDC